MIDADDEMADAVDHHVERLRDYAPKQREALKDIATTGRPVTYDDAQATGCYDNTVLNRLEANGLIDHVSRQPKLFAPTHLGLAVAERIKP